MVEITGRYVGDLKMELTHGPSGAVIRTAAPVDNNGDGSSYSPTDLLAASLGCCIVTVMAIVAQKEGIPFEGVTFSLQKHMRSDPRRVGSVPIAIQMPAGLSEAHRTRLENVGLACPVGRSLAPELEWNVDFQYEAVAAV